jgi:hypothetical protein
MARCHAIITTTKMGGDKAINVAATIENSGIDAHVLGTTPFRTLAVKFSNTTAS